MWALMFQNATAAEVNFGAGEGNRTLVLSLEGSCSTIELHPQPRLVLAGNPFVHRRSMVGEVGLEPTKP